jgi:hypothetical protein
MRRQEGMLPWVFEQPVDEMQLSKERLKFNKGAKAKSGVTW